MPHFDIVIGVDEYTERMYSLMKQGWFISKSTENSKEWRFVLTGRDKSTRKVIVRKS